MKIILDKQAIDELRRLNYKYNRLYLKIGCWSGLILGLVEDNKINKDDIIIHVDVFDFLIDKDLSLGLADEIYIDYEGEEFSKGFMIYLWK